MQLSRIVVLALVAIALSACTSVQSPTQSDVAVDGAVTSNTTQNITTYTPDGAVTQISDAAPDSGQIDSGRIDYVSSSVSTLLNLGTEGVGVRNPGNLAIAKLDIEFGEALAFEGGDGRVVVPIQALTIEGLENDVTAIVENQTAQSQALVDALAIVTPAQAEAVMAALRRDESIADATAGAIGNALGVVGSLAGP